MDSPFRWNEDNIDHIADHGVAPEEAEYIIRNARRPFPRSIGKGKHFVWGQLPDGTYSQVIFIYSPPGVVYVIQRAADDRYGEKAFQETKAMTSPKKPYGKMNAAELREATREYDRALPVGRDGLPGRAMNLSERKRWNQVHKKMGRPKVGKGVKRVMISMEMGLLKTADNFARERGFSRARLIAESVKAYIAGAA